MSLYLQSCFQSLSIQIFFVDLFFIRLFTSSVILPIWMFYYYFSRLEVGVV